MLRLFLIMGYVLAAKAGRKIRNRDYNLLNKNNEKLYMMSEIENQD